MANHSIVCYAEKTKRKSRDVLEAFAAGAGASMASTDCDALEPGAVVFYGVRPAWSRLWLQAKAEGRTWFYIDNAFFDDSRERRFRVGINCVQQTQFSDATSRLFNFDVKPWKKSGENILVCPQSVEFMRVVEGHMNDWSEEVAAELRHYTTRPLVVRRKSSRKRLREDLEDAWACVVHTSAAANEALLAGVPVFTTGECAASCMGLRDLSLIESPVYPDGRERWVRNVAAEQWTLDEFRRGDWANAHKGDYL